MDYFICLFTVCHLSIMLTVLNGYVLFAANINDFKSIARELVPGNLVDQIAEMAAPVSAKKKAPAALKTEYDNNDNTKIKAKPNNRQNNYKNVNQELIKKPIEPNIEYSDLDIHKSQVELNKNVHEQGEYDSQYTEEEKETTDMSQDYVDEQVAGTLRSRIEKLVKASTAVTRQMQTEPQFDIDELVEKVKERLEKHFEDKYMPKSNAQKQSSHNSAEDNYKDTVTKQVYKHYDAQKKNVKEYADNNDKTRMVKSNANTQKISEPQNQNQFEVYSTENTNEPMMIFEKIDMTAKISKDSYEDYKIPAKDDIFDDVREESPNKKRLHEKPTTKFEKTTRNVIKKPSYDNIKKISNNYQAQVETKDNNDYDYNTLEEYKAKTEHLSYDYSMSTDKDKQNSAVKIKKGTNIPTREHYKMSSPNYAAKIPVRAEKYDFNEPLPQRDREIEDIKHFLNPPASINGRVVLRDGMSEI